MNELKARDIARRPLREFVTYETGLRIRKGLKEFALESYKPVFAASDYLRFMNENACAFTLCSPQSSNHPYVWQLFTVKTQFIYGDSIEECLDKALQETLSET